MQNEVFYLETYSWELPFSLPVYSAFNMLIEAKSARWFRQHVCNVCFIMQSHLSE